MRLKEERTGNAGYELKEYSNNSFIYCLHEVQKVPDGCQECVP